MGKLHASDRSLLADEFHDGLPGGDVGIQIHSGVHGGNSTASFDGGGFGENERGASHGAAAEMHEMPGLWVAVDGGVFAHRGNDDSVS